MVAATPVTHAARAAAASGGGLRGRRSHVLHEHSPPLPLGAPAAPLPPLVRALDGDRDGSISAEEVAASAEALKGLDANKDGKLTEDELRPERPPGPDFGPDGGDREEKRGPKPPAPPLVKALDANDDGEISTEEIELAPESLKALDKNQDGELSRMEMRPNRRAKPAGRD